MDIRIDDNCFDLRANQLVRFDDATGADIVCLRGRLWLTQDGDLNDVVLGAGERCTLDRSGVALVEALEPSSVRVALPVQRARRGSWGSWARQVGPGWGTPVVPAPGLAIRAR
jgi:hypothetical protein